jgi:LysM repeat protein
VLPFNAPNDDDTALLEILRDSSMIAAMDVLGGKWVWIWNWRRCDGGDPARVAERLKAAGCRGALVKAFDGPRWFDQGAPWWEIAASLKERGISVGAWGYCYGDDPADEANVAIEAALYGAADMLVLDVESEFKGRREAAEILCTGIREVHGAAYPLYFSSFALARYHRSFPFDMFNQYCSGAAPQVYWNAFRWPVEQALAETYEDYAALGIAPERVFPVGGLYQQGTTRYPEPDEVREFIRQASARGSAGVSFWSYEHMSDEMWQAVASATMAEAEEEEMSSQEFEQVTATVSGLSARVDRLETEVAGLRAPASVPPRTYSVREGDTLSGIAAQLGLPDWQRLYDANRGVIGSDPNIIQPGQVLVVP